MAGETTSILPADMIDDVRSDHAGETGAVAIYLGVLAVSRDPGVKRFAAHHLRTERRHLEMMDALLTPAQRSRLLPVWRIAGWLTGALPALVGPAAVYRTIDAVETFVDGHYAAQVRKLQGRRADRALCELLEACRCDELAHRDEARRLQAAAAGVSVRCWARLVTAGSHLGVVLARRW